MEVSSDVLRLFQYRWNVPILGILHFHEGLSFTDLVRKTEANRGALVRSLRALAEPGWVIRRLTPHPRYALAAPGRRLALPCVGILRIAEREAMEDLALKRWTLPIAAALEGWGLRFSELRAMLSGVTPRALVLSLKDMQEKGLVHRQILGEFPPAAVYSLTEKGKAFLPSLRKL